MRAKAQAKWFKRTTVSQRKARNKAVRKELRLEAEANENFCAEKHTQKVHHEHYDHNKGCERG